MAQTEEKTANISFNSKHWNDYHVGIHEKKELPTEDALKATIDKFIKLLPNIKKSTKALFLSSDVASAAIYIAEIAGCKVDCVCMTKKSKEKTEALAKEAGIEDVLNIMSYTFDEIPYSHASYDIIFSLDSISKSEHPDVVFKEVARLLVHEGRFAFTDYVKKAPNTNLEDAAEILKTETFSTTNDYLKLADKADLERVYVRERPSDLEKHLKSISGQISGKELKKLESLEEAAKKEDLNWGMFIFQKRNV